MNLQHLREFLVARRKDRGITQAQLAKLMGTTQSAISDMENGVHEPSLVVIIRWAAVLEMQVHVELTEVVCHKFPVSIEEK